MMKNQSLTMFGPASSSKTCEEAINASTHEQSNEEHKFALASLFNSLTNLAGGQPMRQAPLAQPHSPAIESLESSVQTAVAAALVHQNPQLTSSLVEAPQNPRLAQGSQQACADFQDNVYAKQSLQCSLPITDLVNCSNQSLKQPPHRINYCTICNKELCNKYFMKTHMLKMHGISLEMEQPERDDEKDSDQENDDFKEAETDPDDAEAGDEQECFHDDAEDRAIDKGQAGPKSLLSDSRKEGSGQSEQPTERTGNSQQVPRSQDIPSSAQSSKKKTPSAKSGVNSPKKRYLPYGKPATSVLNGFAGNSMGGVVCDICNKELCSKYFLKVHKQNTHGIMTDYQDTASQFIYPFAPSLPLQNPYLGGNQLPTAASFMSSGLFLAGAAAQNLKLPNPASQLRAPNEPAPQGARKCLDSSLKRIRPTSDQKPSLAQMNAGLSVDQSANALSGSTEHLNLIYRLISAQQQQQQQSQQSQQKQESFNFPSGESSLAPVVPLDSMQALICLGAMNSQNPFAGAAISPAMIVDNILRNQHLFNRAQQLQLSDKGTSPSGQSSDKNNNNICGKQAGSKDSSSNSRYFSHYTEACPMCDRRFKSIKWLKTHMMNDHKQEIAAYMQMMMQSMYNNKSQQMAAAAAMATIEQQHQQQQAMHKRVANQPQVFDGQPTSVAQPLMTPCSVPAPILYHTYNQLPPHQNFVQEPGYADSILDLEEPADFRKPKRAKQTVEEDYVIDARCRIKSAPLREDSLFGSSILEMDMNDSSRSKMKYRDGSPCALSFEQLNLMHSQSDSLLSSLQDLSGAPSSPTEANDFLCSKRDSHAIRSQITSNKNQTSNK